MSDEPDKSIDEFLEETQMGNPIVEETAVSVFEAGGVRVIKPHSSELSKLMEQTVNLSSTNVYCEPTCMICTSACRDEIEQFFLEQKDYSRTIELFKSKAGLDVSRVIIENHMSNHSVRGVQEIVKSELIKRINRMAGKNLSTLSQIDMMTNFLLDRMLAVGSLTPNKSESAASVEKLKSQEMSKLMTTWLNILKLRAAIMGEMKSSGELITIPTDSFVAIFNEAALKAQTAGEKSMIHNILKKLQEVSKGA